MTDESALTFSVTPLLPWFCMMAAVALCAHGLRRLDGRVNQPARFAFVERAVMAPAAR